MGIGIVEDAEGENEAVEQEDSRPNQRNSNQRDNPFNANPRSGINSIRPAGFLPSFNEPQPARIQPRIEASFMNNSGIDSRPR